MKRAAVLVLLVLAGLVAPGPAGALPAREPHLPDLVTVAPYALRLETTGGLRRLFFSNTIGNIGHGPLELRARNDASTQTTTAIQEVVTHRADGRPALASATPVGEFAFHPAHSHWHFQDFARYEVRAINGDGTTGGVLATTQKVSFCMIDTDTIDSSLEHFNMGRRHSCGQNARQGLRVGRGDTYTSFLPDQFIDITGVPNGTYRLVSVADPRAEGRPNGRLQESNDTNNAASVDVVVSTGGVSPVPGSGRTELDDPGGSPTATVEARSAGAATATDIDPAYCEIYS
jgi:hypothetical protein